MQTFQLRSYNLVGHIVAYEGASKYAPQIFYEFLVSITIVVVVILNETFAPQN